jgi:hypothetical protein
MENLRQDAQDFSRSTRYGFILYILKNLVHLVPVLVIPYPRTLCASGRGGEAGLIPS